jgi:hypothetical protein
MKLKTLATDKTLVPTSLSLEDRSMRGGFIVIRVRQIRNAASDPEDIPDADIPALKTQLATEIANADTAVQQILILVKADETADVLYKLSDVDARMKKAYISQGIVKSDLSAFRSLTVKVIGWWLLGDDFSLSANINDLHYLVDRKLRIMERMMYDVGRVDNRSWTKKTINTDIAGDWKDGWNRMFEYPRISQSLFLSHCDPDATTQVCKKPELSDWLVKGSTNLSLVKTARVNPAANTLWEQQTLDDYDFFFKSPAVNDPEVALNKLFTPSEDYKSRNLLFCDHVIHILHMEALLFSKKKRSADMSWLKNYINNVDGKMRIYFLNNSVNEYLAGPKDATFFKYKRVKVSELQIGDQLIVYNHPAYDKATVGGVWRLENALVVTIFPKLCLQGHGTHPLTFGQMKNIVVKLFNGEVDKLRARVESLINSGSTDKEIDFGGKGKLILRTDSSLSLYSSTVRKADWWLRWPHDPEKDDAAIASDPQRKTLAWQVHKVDYDNTYGYFPLWQPVTLHGNPIIKSGKISKIQKVIITPEMIAGWTWNLPVDVKDREMSVVLRPKN